MSLRALFHFIRRNASDITVSTHPTHPHTHIHTPRITLPPPSRRLQVFSAPNRVRRGRAAKKIQVTRDRKPATGSDQPRPYTCSPQQAWRRAHGKTWRQVFRHHDDVLLRQLKQVLTEQSGQC